MTEEDLKKLGLVINKDRSIDIESLATSGKEAIDQINAIKKYYDLKGNGWMPLSDKDSLYI